MQIHLANMESDGELRADICIIGAGAAGISLALQLDGAGRDVLLLEGGDFEPSAESQDLYVGKMLTTSAEHQRDYVVKTRLRYFGGTTNHWSGWCRPLDPLLQSGRVEIRAAADRRVGV